MKKRILSVLLVVAMLATMIVLPVYADGNATVNTKTHCPHCNTPWANLEIVNLDYSEGFAEQLVLGAEGKVHYKLVSDITNTTVTNAVSVEEGATVVLDMNGHNIAHNRNGRALYFSKAGANVYLLNSSDTASEVSNKSTGMAGGALFAGSAANVHIYDITLNGSSSSSYDNYASCVGISSATVTMHSGTINGATNNSSSKDIAAVNMTGANATFIMLGGTVNAGTRTYAISHRSGATYTGETVDLRGGVVNGKVYLQAREGNNFKVSGNPEVSELVLTDVTTVTVGALTEGASIGVSGVELATAFTNAGVGAYADYFYGYTDKWYQMEAYALEDGALALRDTLTCPHCDKLYSEITWTEYQYKNNVDLQEGGHYYMTSAKGGSNEVIMGKAGTEMEIILDLNGIDITASNRVFSVAEDCSLFLMDSVGGAVVTGGRTAGTGSTIVLAKRDSALTLYGGTYTQKEANTNPNNGGVIYSNGNLTVTGDAVVTGGKTTASGGNIFAANGSTLTVSGNAQVYGGQAVAGSDIYSAGAELTIGENITGDIKIGFPNSVVTADRSLNYITYGADVQNPDLTLTADNAASDCNGAPIMAKDGKLYVAEGTALAKQDGENTEYTWFNTAAEAVAAYDAGGYDYIVVYGQDLALNGSEYVIDINGFNVEMTAEAATTAYCFDTANHEYKNFGTVTAGENVTVKSIDDSDAQVIRATAGNYVVLENEGVYSVHALNMDVSAIGLRTASNGMYYYANYKCDDTLKAEILSYGIEYALYDENKTAPIENTTSQTIDIENSGESALVTNEDIAIGGMNGVIGSDINGYSDAECGKMKIMATPVVAVGNQIYTGETVGYSMYDCCQAAYNLIAEYNASEDAELIEKAGKYTTYMNVLFTETWAEYDLSSWVFENVPEVVA